jgi:hypothetical protein
VDDSKALELSDNNFMGLGDVLRALDYGSPEGITETEVHKVYNYLHNRLTGRAKGGEFLYRVYDSEGDRVEDADVPFDIRSPQTPISWVARDNWDEEPEVETADYLTADTFIFADAPAVQKAARRLGYNALIYPDVFAGGGDASEELLGKEVDDLYGIEMAYDLDDDFVPTHTTFRVLDPSAILGVTTTPTEDVEL